ncbi:hypothetical protein GJ699_33345 [Duganella sp. FT80W]|uniref:Uncharacterized protein n=1 Tax=Duganella guangzhouensis TaxID=2666084 RepID=A0A6I2LAJ1_9BURK|nr:hypothetical protein [Duganella guangzhouensis]MRW94853.1 hypothetical protein [Duganella guangzhouensis]
MNQSGISLAFVLRALRCFNAAAFAALAFFYFASYSLAVLLFDSLIEKMRHPPAQMKSP